MVDRWCRSMVVQVKLLPIWRKTSKCALELDRKMEKGVGPCRFLREGMSTAILILAVTSTCFATSFGSGKSCILLIISF